MLLDFLFEVNILISLVESIKLMNFRLEEDDILWEDL